MNFDVVVGNPPFQAPKDIGSGRNRKTLGSDIWSKFVEVSVELCKDRGYIALIHPPLWRKPGHRIWPLLTNYKIKYLSIHNQKDGQNTFDAATRYDWYVVQKSRPSGATTVRDELGGISQIVLNQWEFLPNYNYWEFDSILAAPGEEVCEVLYSRSYASYKKYMSETQSSKNKYPCVYGMYKDGTHKYLYSSLNSEGHFGIPKVIISCGRYPYPHIDMEGRYGMTENAFAIKVDSLSEAENIKKAIQTYRFKNIITCSKWGTFRIEWRMFKYFKKDFWKEFV